MTRIIGVAGSLRQASFNAALLRAATGLMPAGATLVPGTIAGIPLYDGDREAADGLPPAVQALKEAIAQADGLILATPEYNGSIPGVLKNAVDWLSRPPADLKRVFGGKPVALIGASPGGFGTVLAQAAWLPVLRALGAQLWSDGRLLASRAHTLFDPDGALTDDAVRGQLRQFLEGFTAFVRARATPPGN